MNVKLRSSSTIFYSLLYLNSRIDFDGLKYLYSVFSVIEKRLPGNTKKLTIVPFVDGHSAIFPWDGISCALPIPAPNLFDGIPLPIFQFWCGEDCFLKKSTLKWCGDQPRGGSKGVISCFRKPALGGASWYLFF